MLSQKADFTLSDFYKCWVVVELKLSSRAKHPSKTKLETFLLKSLKQRENKIIDNNLMQCAMVLDPRFCDEVFDYKLAEAKNVLLNMYNRMKIFRTEADESTTEAVCSSSSADIFAQYLKNKTKQRNQMLDRTITDDEIFSSIDSFIQNDAMHTTDESWSILQFWEDKKKDYPALYELAMVIYAIAPTQVTVERNFSVLGYIFNDRRSNLSQKLLEDVLLIVLNQDLFELVNEEKINTLLSSGN